MHPRYTAKDIATDVLFLGFLYLILVANDALTPNNMVSALFGTIAGSYAVRVFREKKETNAKANDPTNEPKP
jgi:hypothetical protein